MLRSAERLSVVVFPGFGVSTVTGLLSVAGRETQQCRSYRNTGIPTFPRSRNTGIVSERFQIQGFSVPCPDPLPPFPQHGNVHVSANRVLAVLRSFPRSGVAGW